MFRRKRLITALLLVLMLAAGWWLVAGNPLADHSIRVSAETTHITEPLDAEGYVDYVAALNQMASEGVTPANNAAAAIIEVLGPAPKGDPLPDNFFDKLGIPRPPADGEYFVSSDAFIDRLPEPEPDNEQPPEDAFWEGLCRAAVRPWTPDDVPLMAEWLELNGPHLDKVAAATNERDRWFMPLLDGVPLIEQPFHEVAVRDVARALSARAMRRAAEGDVDDACADIIACRRLGQLMRQSQSGVFMAIGIESMAIEAQVSLLHFADLTPDQLARLAEPCDDLPAGLTMADHIDRGERFLALDSVTNMARGKNGNNNGPLRRKMLMRGLNWNLVLRRCNQAYDKLVDPLRLDDARKRDQQVEAASEELNRTVASRSKGWTSKLRLISPNGLGEAMADVLVSFLLPAADVAQRFGDRRTILCDLARVAVALAAYRAEHGEYPASLERLVPGHIGALPTDIYADGPYRYRRTDDGCVLYSVGRNGEDDRGMNADDEPGADIPPEADDIPLHMPPKLPPP